MKSIASHNAFIFLCLISLLISGCTNDVEVDECLTNHFDKSHFQTTHSLLGMPVSILESEDGYNVLLHEYNATMVGLTNDYSIDNTYDLGKILIEGGRTFLKTSDNDFVALYLTQKTVSQPIRINLVKLRNGEKIWHYQNHEPFSMVAEAMVALPNGDFLITGNASDNLTGFYNFFITRINSDGSKLWTQFKSADSNDRVEDMLLTDQNTVVILKSHKIDDQRSISLDHYSFDGEFNHSNAYDDITNLSHSHFTFRALKEGGYLIGANQFSESNKNDLNNLVVKLNSNYETEWSSRFGQTGTEFLHNIIELENQEILALGSSSSTCDSKLNMYVSRLDSEGNVLWEKTYGGIRYSVAIDAIELATDRILICGGEAVDPISANVQEADLILLEIDRNGNPI